MILVELLKSKKYTFGSDNNKFCNATICFVCPQITYRGDKGITGIILTDICRPFGSETECRPSLLGVSKHTRLSIPGEC